MSKFSYPSWITSHKMGFLYRFVLGLMWVFFKVVYRHRIFGKEHYYHGGALLASNHVSNLDPPIMAISWFDEVHFLAKESLFKIPGLGWLIRSLNSHPISGEASDIKVFKLTCKLLEEGKHVVLFPEGTRSLDNTLSEIKPGIGMLVMRAKSAIVPVYIHGTFDIWNRERTFPKLFGRTACVFGSPIISANYLHLDKKEAQKQITEQLYRSILNLKTWYEAGANGTPP